MKRFGILGQNLTSTSFWAKKNRQQQNTSNKKNIAGISFKDFCCTLWDADRKEVTEFGFFYIVQEKQLSSNTRQGEDGACTLHLYMHINQTV